MAGIEEKVIPLALLPSGKSGKIVRIDAGHGLMGRLCSMGIIPGESIKKISSGFRGPQMCCVKGTYYGMGRGMTSKIYVEYKNEIK